MPQWLRSCERQAVAWKNGGGTTREVMVFPQDATMETFVWRISMADVTQPGPFSSFPGITRTLAVVSGCLELDFQGGATHRLGPSDPVIVFPGDAKVSGAPIGGPVLDLNVMARNGVVQAAMQRIDGGGHDIACRPGDVTVMVATGPAVVQISQQHRLDLDTWDAFQIDGDENDLYKVFSALPFFLIRISVGAA